MCIQSVDAHRNGDIPWPRRAADEYAAAKWRSVPLDLFQDPKDRRAARSLEASNAPAVKPQTPLHRQSMLHQGTALSAKVQAEVAAGRDLAWVISFSAQKEATTPSKNRRQDTQDTAEELQTQHGASRANEASAPKRKQPMSGGTSIEDAAGTAGNDATYYGPHGTIAVNELGESRPATPRGHRS